MNYREYCIIRQVPKSGELEQMVYKNTRAYQLERMRKENAQKAQVKTDVLPKTLLRSEDSSN